MKAFKQGKKKVTGEGVRDNAISNDKLKSLIKKVVKAVEEKKTVFEFLFSGFKSFKDSYNHFFQMQKLH